MVFFQCKNNALCRILSGAVSAVSDMSTFGDLSLYHTVSCVH